ncbi:S8 family serine peptidase [Kribbella sp. NPDC023855]|uniref:S8 family serine peptidase n=1 Tax=Kribbella sp. NPDC023855 TaxID=3154698 RepID=UPI0033EAA4C5
MARRSRTRPAIAAVAIAGLALSGVTAQAGAAPVAGKPPAPAGKDVHVTLITGDRVVLHGGDPAKQSIERGAGRDRVSFQTYRSGDHAYVIPSDVTKAIGAGRLDKRLFDVTGLIKAGYDDASSTVIPVLATYDGAAKRSAPVGAKVKRQLPSIKGAALAVDKAKAGAFLAKPGGSAKIWLDGMRQVTLDQTVPQIGAPAAWEAGYTGKDVKVAVLDTGIDASHPDLASQVVEAKNFTDAEAGDHFGHGTHVASTIAGTGAASGGKYKGVAPDARLYDGQVCDGFGQCPDSAIVAAMEWAAKDVKAAVINVSLGGPDTPEVDPLEEAVNRLTAETGALFVIAAGNSGPAARTVGSPGSADAALTVGAVDKQDQLADFSSRGPRVGDSALKPDVTGPGVAVVAAKAKDSIIGEPVGEQYLQLSGTSMAAPHTAGAAALLMQQHPAWKAGELKSTLMGSAKAAADQTAVQQGAGRIDVAAAVKQNVVAVEGNVSFGLATYPHTDDEPVTKTLTYRNLGDEAVTLQLAATFNDAAGSPAPAGALQLSATTVTVPAGQTASVQVTSNTKHTGPDGFYSGRIVATGGGHTIGVPVAVEKEVESYNLTVKTIDPAGAPSVYPVAIIDVDNPELTRYDTNGTLTVKLPKGDYVVEHFLEHERAADDWAIYEMAAPSVTLDADRTVVLDARLAKPVRQSAPAADAEQVRTEAGFTRQSATPGALRFSLGMAVARDALYTLGTGPTLPAAQLTGYVTSQLAKRGADGRFTNTPYVYQLARTQPGVFATGFERVARPDDLATVTSTINATSGGSAVRFVWPVISGIAPAASGIRFDQKRTVSYYYDEIPDGWLGAADAMSDGFPPEYYWSQESVSPRMYRAGRTYEERWNTAAFGPRVFWAARTGTMLEVLAGSLGDAEGNYGSTAMDSASITLYRDGVQVASNDGHWHLIADGLPAGKAAYKLVTTGTQSRTEFATRADLTATFTSAATTQATPVSISTVRFQPKVDGDNLADRTKVTVLPVVVDGATDLKSLKVEVSGDNGTTWKQALVTRTTKGYQAAFITPAGPTVSLRAHLVDRAGNTTDQSVISAYKLK